MKTEANDSISPTTYMEHGSDGRGLTKREYFAAMAMQGLLSLESNNNTLDQDADIAVKCADALVDALNKDRGES